MRYSQLLLLLVLVPSVVGTWPAKADSPDPKDVSTLNSCLATLDKAAASQEIDEATCLLKVANPCIGDAASVSDGKQIECLDREQRAWDKMINDSYKIVMNGLEPEPASKLRDMQRGWIRVRDQTCTFWYDYFQGTMANLMTASCQNRETARRAIYLRVFAIDIAQRK